MKTHAFRRAALGVAACGLAACLPASGQVQPDRAGQVPPHLGFHRETAFYWNDFEDQATAGKGWSRQETYRLPVTAAGAEAPVVGPPSRTDGRTARSDPAVGGVPGETLAAAAPTTVLGRFGNTPVSLTIEGLPPHRFVQVAFEFYALSSWDGDQPGVGPDLWLARLEDGPRLVHASFGMPGFVAPSQSFPFPHGLGAVAPGSAGRPIRADVPSVAGWPWTRHTVYPMCFTVPHSATTLCLRFTGIGLQALGDESWALDNVGVAVLDQCPVQELTPQQLQQAWDDLAPGDAGRAWSALLALTGAGDQGAAFLIERLGLEPDAGLRAHVEALASAFEHDDPDQWREAAQEMPRLPPQALPLACSGLDRRRLSARPLAPLLREFVDCWAPITETDPDRQRQRLAVHALELLWTDAARRALLFE